MADPIQEAPSEHWKPVVGYEGLYEASTRGRIRSVNRTVFTTARAGARHFKGRMLKLGIHPGGYLSVALCRDGISKVVLVHRVVLEAHAGPCEDGQEACHGDGNRKNNALSNLRWDTRRQNMSDKVDHGTQPRGRGHWNARLTEAQVVAIKRLLRKRVTQAEIAVRFGIAHQTVSQIKRGQRWKHIAP